MKIAVIGSGIAGLSFAWLASTAGHQVTIFERQSALGMDAHSIDLPLGGINSSGRIDVPPRMFNRDEWPTLAALYENLGVQSQNVDASKSFSIMDPANPASVSPWIKLGDRYVSSFAANLLTNSSARATAAAARRLRSTITDETVQAMSMDQTFEQFLAAGQYDDRFVKDFLYPGLAATVFTCSYQAIDQYPAKIVLANLLNQFDRSPLQRTVFGTRDVVQRISASFSQIRLDTTIATVKQSGDVAVAVLDQQGQQSEYDHLVIATQANSAVSILGDRFPLASSLLSEFVYENVSVIVHDDDRLVPSQRQRCCFNFVSDRQRRDAMCTICLNRFYPETDWQRPIFQTIRPWQQVAEKHVIARAAMQRPVVTATTMNTVKALRNHQRQTGNCVWFCGSYAAPGVPLLESGVASAIYIARQLNVPVPANMQRVQSAW